jgi:murein DD-endopeptidase MepM/ murein hydrolase activator NlpD
MGMKKSKSSLGTLLALGAVVGGSLFVYGSSMFERDLPEVKVHSNGYWNLKDSIALAMNDASGIKSYKVTLQTQNEEIVLKDERFLAPKMGVELNLKPPRSAYTIKDESVTLVVEATDASKWNFFKGNSVTHKYNINIDKKRPQISIVTNSYKISRGGSATVIFYADDKNLEELYIETNYGKKFKPQPFYKEGYYISLLAWDLKSSNFKATVVAKDLAGNSAKSYVPLYLKEKNYKISNIALSDRFLKGKIADLAEEFAETQGVSNSLEQFKIINEDVRAKNEDLIHKITSKVSDERIDDFNINKMYPLRNGQVVAHFGDHRKYFYDNDFVSEAYHMGLDLASNSMANIIPQNGGDVVYAEYNGLYGNMPIVDHGLGLYTLYGHCSTLSTNSGSHLRSGEVIAKTGKTGYAMGDHLHFGVLVQGVEVRPQEWMDKDWIKLNVSNVIKKAKKIIDRN